MVLWAIAVLALLVAVVSLSHARRLARRFETLNQAYWELRYDYTRLRSQVARLDPEQAQAEAEPAPSPAGAPTMSFVPLSSIKKKAQ